METQLLIIEKLREVEGIGPATVSKLRGAGFYTVESVAVTPVRELIDKTKMGDEVAERVIDAARDLVSAGFISSFDLYQAKKTALKLKTGSEALDGMLGGGIETQAITELVGEFGTGKSQICMQLACNAQLPKEDGGLEGEVVFIDTEGTFAPQRVYEMAQGIGLDPEKALKGITYGRSFSSDHQMLLVDRCGEIIQSGHVKLIVVDSVVGHFRGEYLGRESLAERQQKLNLHLHKLLRLAEANNLAVVVTNQVIANPQAFFGDPNRPAGGNVLAHTSTHRVYLRKCKGNLRHAMIIDSPSLPSDVPPVSFMITSKGIEDAPEKSGRGVKGADDDEEEGGTGSE